MSTALHQMVNPALRLPSLALRPAQMLEAHRAQALPTVDAATEPPTLTVRNAVQARAKLSPAQQRTLEAALPDG